MKLRMALLLVGLPLGLYVFGLTIPDASAQTETILYSFGSSSNDGNGPAAGVVQGEDGNFYGTTFHGGTNGSCYEGCGTVFRINPDGICTTLYSFGSSANDGEFPDAGLVQGSDGNFYGTTFGGGTHGDGTVFRIGPSDSYTSLYSFGNSPKDGGYPIAGLVQGTDSNFYGTTDLGGTLGFGTVFRISPSGSYTSLYSFVGYPNDGANPYAGLVQGSDGNFYGMTHEGGTNNHGTVFRISPGGNHTHHSLLL